MTLFMSLHVIVKDNIGPDVLYFSLILSFHPLNAEAIVIYVNVKQRLS